MYFRGWLSVLRCQNRNPPFCQIVLESSLIASFIWDRWLSCDSDKLGPKLTGRLSRLNTQLRSRGALCPWSSISVENKWKTSNWVHTGWFHAVSWSSNSSQRWKTASTPLFLPWRLQVFLFFPFVVVSKLLASRKLLQLEHHVWLERAFESIFKRVYSKYRVRLSEIERISCRKVQHEKLRK